MIKFPSSWMIPSAPVPRLWRSKMQAALSACGGLPHNGEVQVVEVPSGDAVGVKQPASVVCPPTFG